MSGAGQIGGLVVNGVEIAQDDLEACKNLLGKNNTQK